MLNSSSTKKEDQFFQQRDKGPIQIRYCIRRYRNRMPPGFSLVEMYFFNGKTFKTNCQKGAIKIMDESEKGFSFLWRRLSGNETFFLRWKKSLSCKPGTRARTLIRSRWHSIRVWNRSSTRKQSSLFEQQMFVAIEQRGKAFKSLEIEHNSLCTTTMAFDYHLALMQTSLNECTFSARKIKK